MSNVPRKFLSSAKRIWNPPCIFKTGIDDLDKILGGGFPEKSIVLVIGPRQSGKTTLFKGFFANFYQNLKLKQITDNGFWRGVNDYLAMTSSTIISTYNKSLSIRHFVENDCKDTERKLSIYSQVDTIFSSADDSFDSFNYGYWSQFIGIVLKIDINGLSPKLEVWKREFSPISSPITTPYLKKIGDVKFPSKSES